MVRDMFGMVRVAGWRFPANVLFGKGSGAFEEVFRAVGDEFKAIPGFDQGAFHGAAAVELEVVVAEDAADFAQGERGEDSFYSHIQAYVLLVVGENNLFRQLIRSVRHRILIAPNPRGNQDALQRI